MREASSSLAQRIALVAAASTAAGAIVAAVLALVVADGLVGREEDRRLDDAARSVLLELADEESDPSRVIEEEAHELAVLGLRMTAFDAGRRLGGDARLAAPPRRGCDGPWHRRRCAIAEGSTLVVVASVPQPGERWQLLRMLGSLLAIGLAAILGAAASGSVARRVVAPLTRLREAVAAVPSLDPAGAALGEDERIAEVDELRHAIAALLERLDSAMAQSRRFSADAAHELRTPLTALRTELELLGEAHRDEPSLAEPIARATRRTEDLGELVERLLILARPAGGTSGFADWVDLRDTVEDVLLDLPDTERARVELVADDDLSAIRGDASLLRSLVRNAIDNALKFSGSDAVRVAVEEREGQVRLDVVDRGPGVPGAERTKVFEAFYRSADARAVQPGHGIGLALIAHVARAHGGDARFLDAERGAHLRVTFPVATGPRA